MAFGNKTALPAPVYGTVETLSPLVRHVLARNPSAFTFTGTATFIVGHGQVAVIDPGPDDAEHVEALKTVLGTETVSHILITHGHEDHVGALEAFASATGAEIFGYEQGKALRDGDIVAGPGWTLEAIHTPGHASNHLCYAFPEEQTIFSGDHVMGWSTTVVPLPDGNMTDYMASLEKLARRPEPLFRPTHGPAIEEAQRYTTQLLFYRRRRAREILKAIETGADRFQTLKPLLYPRISSELEKAAGATLLAHLQALEQEGSIVREDDRFRVTEAGADYLRVQTVE